MTTISIGQALGAGFRLIGREPQAFAVWCAFYFLLAAAPALLSWEQTRALYASFGDSVGQDSASVLAAQTQLVGAQMWAILPALVGVILLPAAMLRAVLYPDDRRFFYLRLSRRELWLWLNALALGLVLLAGWFGAVLLVGVVVGGSAAAGGGGGALVGGIIGFLAMLVLMFAWPWLMMRTSMIPLMGFVERKLQLTQGWRLTKGHAWRLFLVGLIFVLALIAIEMVVFGVILGAAGGDVMNAGASMMSWMSRLTLPVMVVTTLVSTVFGVAMYVVATAAWADMYRQINPDLEDTFA